MKKLSLFKRENPKGLECLNCSMPLRGDENFCANCGQKNDVRKLRLSHFISEFLAGFVSYDFTLWRTLKPILLSPGKVSLEFIRGKRKRYVNPFRFYFTVSVIYFLVIGLSSKWNELNSFNTGESPVNFNMSEGLTDAQEKELQEAFYEVDSIMSRGNIIPVSVDSITTHSELLLGKNIEKAMYLFKNDAGITADAALEKLQIEPTLFYRVLFHKMRDYYNGNIAQNIKMVLNSFVSKISISLFLLLPIFTFFVWLVYWRKKRSYMEHLVFVFNTQTVLFLLLLIFFFIDLIMETENQWWLTFLLFSVYLFLALRGFYEQGFIKTAFKYLILNSIYFLLASVGFVIVSGLSILF